jgi:hypothetical protein
MILSQLLATNSDGFIVIFSLIALYYATLMRLLFRKVGYAGYDVTWFIERMDFIIKFVISIYWTEKR